MFQICYTSLYGEGQGGPLSKISKNRWEQIGGTLPSKLVTPIKTIFSQLFQRLVRISPAWVHFSIFSQGEG